MKKYFTTHSAALGYCPSSQVLRELAGRCYAIYVTYRDSNLRHIYGSRVSVEEFGLCELELMILSKQHCTTEYTVVW